MAVSGWYFQISIGVVMLFNETVLSLKLRYLDSTPLDLVRHVAETLAGKGAHVV